MFCINILTVDGKDPFPLVMVGTVLEANKRWDIGNEVISCISRDFSGVLPIHPKVSKHLYIIYVYIYILSSSCIFPMKGMNS